ncbi:MAG: hypothetical protein Fur0018_02910 [Anaerolineales bacterium]
MKFPLRKYTILLTGAGLIAALDQYTKALVRTHLTIGQQWAPWDWLLPYARIVHWTNRGAAFGIFQNGSLFFTLLAFVVAILILAYYPRIPHHEWGLRIALVLQLGGAVGNLLDRLQHGQVTDFISVGSFAVFNVADASISIGAAILMISYWLQERQHSPEAVQPPVEPVSPQPEALPQEDVQR